MGKFPFRIAAAYAAFAALWIALSDRLVVHLFPATFAQYMTIKGWGFVVVTTGLLFVLLRREAKRHDAVETRLSDSERRLEATFEQAAIGIAHVGLDGRFLRVNTELCAVLGYDREDLLRRRFQDITHPDDLVENLRNRDGLLAGTIRSYGQEKRYIRQDGSTVWGHLNVSLVRDAAGEPDYFIATIDEITRRKEAQAALDHERRFIRTVLETVSDGVLACDAEGNTTLYNRALRAFHDGDGGGPDAPFGEPWLPEELSFPGTPGPLAREDIPLFRALKGERVRNVELVITPKNGPPHTALVNAEPMRDEEGRLVGAVVVVRDITEWARAEASRRDSEARLRAVLDNAPASIVLKDTEGRFLIANQVFLDRYGLTAETLVGKTGHDVYRREVAEESIKQERLVLEAGRAMAFEVVRDSGTADERTYIILRFPVMAEDGATLGVGVITLDISERKEAERALAASEQRLALALQASNDGLWDWDLVTGRVFFSERYKAILGLGPDGLTDTYAAFHERVHPDDKARVDAFVAAVRDGPRDRFEEEFRMRHKDGHYVDIMSRGYLVRDETGRPIRLTGTHTDVTELRAVQAQLVQAYKLRAIGQLAGGTAHDFNNLLQVIQTSLELAILQSRDEGVRLFLDHALQAAKRGGRLTQQLLSFSRKQPLRPEIVRPARLIEGMIDLVRRTLGEDIEIDMRIDDDLPPVAIDAHGLENAILNIALNARAAMPDGGTLTVRTTLRRLDRDTATDDGTLPAADYVEIALSDTGCGMPPDVVEHAFEPFFTTREIGQGSGLGLSMVYGFAKQSGGQATLDSTPGQGTTVTLLLPAATVLA